MNPKLSTQAGNNSRLDSFKRIMDVVSKRAGHFTLYSTAILGLLALNPETTLNPALTILASSIGVEAIGIVIDRVTSGKNLSESAIYELVVSALEQSGIEKLATKEDLAEGISHLIRRISSFEGMSKEVLEHLSQLKLVQIESNQKLDIYSIAILDRLETLQETVQLFRGEYVKKRGQDLNLEPNILPSGVLNLDGDDAKRGAMAANIFRQITSIILRMAKHTRTHNDDFDMAIKRIDFMLKNPRHRSKQNATKLVEFLSEVKYRYLIALEELVPEFAHLHSLGIDLYVRDAMYWFSLGTEESEQVVRNQYDVLTGVYKPELERSLQAGIMMTHESESLIVAFRGSINKATAKVFLYREERLRSILNYHNEIRQEAMQHVLKAENILQSTLSYLEFNRQVL